jgi:hypothetical protein
MRANPNRGGWGKQVRILDVTTQDGEIHPTAPATLAQQWDHRPDLDFSPPSEVCDDEVGARYRAHVPE